MKRCRVDQQVHGYRNGHELLSGSLVLSRSDQDTVDRLSDIAGPLRPNETFTPYITAYPLPSRRHYVVARTWQDTDAPRAGCVVTRSIMIPMFTWESTKCFDGILSLLVPVKSNEKATSSQIVLLESSHPAMKDSRVVELVEALFLEKQQPIVFFEPKDPEAITIRLLTSMWPALRRTFAICTLALAPRSIEGRDFDLVFAPRTARTRFSDCPHRRIDIGNSRTPRHRWSAAVASKIFESDVPNLLTDDTLGVLKADTRGDRSALRVSLLWNELAKKTQATPTAVLGMLDILTLRSDLALQARAYLDPIVQHSISKASSELPEAEAWTFLAALFAKLENQHVSDRSIRKTEQSASNLASRSPKAAFDFLQLEARNERDVSANLIAAIGNGLTTSRTFDQITNHLEMLPPSVGLNILAMSAEFALTATTMAKRQPAQWIPSLIRLLSAPNEGLKQKARQHLVQHIDDSALAPLLPSLLEKIDARELSSVVIQIGKNTNFETDAFDDALISAIKATNSVSELRDAISIEFNNRGSNRFLLRTLQPIKHDINWLCRGDLTKPRAARLLNQLLEETSDHPVLNLLRDTTIRARILELLLSDPQMCAPQVSRLLTLDVFRADEFFNVVDLILSPLDANGDTKFVSRLLVRALTDASPHDPRVSTFLSRTSSGIDAHELIRMLSNPTATPERIGANIYSLEAVPSRVRKNIISIVDKLSEQLVYTPRGNFGKAAYNAWASMIKEASTRNPNAQMRAATLSLTYAFKSIIYPVSELVVVSFPIVYCNLSNLSQLEINTMIPSLLSESSTFCSTEKELNTVRRKLVGILINTFLKSSWPPANLILAVLEAKIENKVAKRVRKRKIGDEYIRAIRQDSARLGKSERRRVLSACGSTR